MGHSEDDAVHKIPHKMKTHWQNKLKFSVLVWLTILYRYRYKKIDVRLVQCPFKVLFMQPSMGTLNAPLSRIVKDSTPSRRRILRYINFGIGESYPILFLDMVKLHPNNIWSMVNFERTCVLLFYYFLCLKVNLDLEKNKSAWWIFTQLYFRGGKSWPNNFGKEVNWWWILT